MAQVFAASMFGSSDLCFSCLPSSPGMEQDSDNDKQKEKEIIEIGCNHWSHRVEVMKRLTRRFSLSHLTS